MQMLFPLQPRNRGLSSRTNASDCGIGAGSVHTRCIAHSAVAAPQRYQNATLTTGTLNRSNYLSAIARDHGRHPRAKSAVATALTPQAITSGRGGSAVSVYAAASPAASVNADPAAGASGEKWPRATAPQGPGSSSGRTWIDLSIY